MKSKSIAISWLITIWILVQVPVFSIVYQDFEADNGTGGDYYGWTWGNSNAQISASEAHSGQRSWKLSNQIEEWIGTGIQAQIAGWDTDFESYNNDRLSIWVKAYPNDGTNNNVGIKFFDKSTYSNGVTVWTRKKTKFGEWTEISVLFSQLPSDFDLAHVDKIEIHHAKPGEYYVDDIRVIREDRFYQSFDDPAYLEQGSPWAWKGTVSVSNEKFHDGGFSLKFEAESTPLEYDGTGFNCQNERFTGTVDQWSNALQSCWNVDFNPAMNDRLTFCVYSLPFNGMDTTIYVIFYDHENYFNNGYTIESTVAAQYAQWTEVSIPFSKLPQDFNLNNINKLIFMVKWPGTYYLDSIATRGSIPYWNRDALENNLIEWMPVDGSSEYELQEKSSSNQLNWQTIFSGTLNQTPFLRITDAFYRVRAKTGSIESPFVSNWSEELEVNAPLIAINKTRLQKEGYLEWNQLLNATSYEIETSSSVHGPWTTFYSGPYPLSPIQAAEDVWYRVRGSRNNGEKTDWSHVARKSSIILDDFLRPLGKKIVNKNGYEITLRGFNLGSLLLIEPWMTAIGNSDYPDDYSIRSQLDALGYDSESVLEIFQNSFIQTADLDNLARMGVNFVRLPLYYRNFTDEYGNDLPNAFDKVDRIIQGCADRGIYVLLDLHGAPGSQSNEFHTGRQNFNQLFNFNSTEYLNQTKLLWTKIAGHYKNEPFVLGYDLLNEPVGVFTYYPIEQDAFDALKTVYNELYQSVRSVDANHIIVMEGIWDLNSLPAPATMNWERVVYQIHTYLFDSGTNILRDWGFYDFDLEAMTADHQNFLNEKCDYNVQIQNNYNVPVMVGEFSALDSRPLWDFYLTKYNEAGWSWTIWNYKANGRASYWGIYNHSRYDDTFPDLENDSLEVLTQKLLKYDTKGHYECNKTLKEIITPHIAKKNCIWSPNANGTLYNNISWNYTLGFHFTPLKNGVISMLGGYFNGAKTVSLWNRNTGELLREIQIESDNNWSYVEIDPVLVDEGEEYTVAVYLNGNGGSYRRVAQVFPMTYSDVTILGSCWALGNARPGNLITNAMYGQVDIAFVSAMESPNSVPQFTTTPVKDAFAGEPYSYGANATDPENDELTFSLLEYPEGMTINSVTGEISWLPSASFIGSHTVTIEVSDGRDGTASQTFVLQVHINSLDAQTPWKTNENGIMHTGLTWNYTLGYHFSPEKNGSIDKLGGCFNGTKTVYLWDRDTRELLRETSISSNNSWAFVLIDPVSVTKGKNYTVGVYTNGNGASYRTSIQTLPRIYNDITIQGSCWFQGNGRPVNLITNTMYGQVDVSFVPDSDNNNQNPIITSTPVSHAIVNELYTYHVEASDPDEDQLTFALTQNPAGMEINSQTGSITWTPEDSQTGTHSVIVEVNDGRTGIAIQSFTVEVLLNSVNGQMPWKNNENGTMVSGLNWNYTLGYHFIAQKNGNINKLGGCFNGTKRVYLWNRDTGDLLKEIQVTSANNWAFADIDPVSITAGGNYTVAVFTDGSGASYRNGVQAFPQIFEDITIQASCWLQGDGRPINSVQNTMYGQVDIYFVPDE